MKSRNLSTALVVALTFVLVAMFCSAVLEK